jgi:choline dehydrogenase
VEFKERVRSNQERLTIGLKEQNDFIVCGSGSSGSVVARRLAENPEVNVLLLEAGGDDDVASIREAASWPMNLGGEHDWNFSAQPNPSLNGRSLPLSMGKVLGGGSSINLMIWARGHKHDWDFFAEEAGDPAWNYESVLRIYRRIEDWHGAPDPEHRGTGGLLYVQPGPTSSPQALAVLEGARSVGIPTYENQNGRLMERDGGASIIDLRVREGKRQSVFRSYVFPIMDKPNLTVLTRALVTRLTFDGKRVTGVEIDYQVAIRRIGAASEVVLSLGAIHTPKVLMQSGIGDHHELRRAGIPIVEHLPGVGQNFQDHVGFNCVWENREPHSGAMVDATFFAKSDASIDTPDLHTFFGRICHVES